jgi:hypothetical protein
MGLLSEQRERWDIFQREGYDSHLSLSLCLIPTSWNSMVPTDVSRPEQQHDTALVTHVIPPEGWYCASFITPRTYTSFLVPLADLHPGRRV